MSKFLTDKKYPRFAELLTEGIYAIQNNESKKTKKFIKDIESELGRSIGKTRALIASYRTGNYIPATRYAKEQLARDLLNRGKLNEEWLVEFLYSVEHPQPSTMIDELFSPDDKTPEYLLSDPKNKSSHNFKRRYWKIEIQINLDRPSTSTGEIEVQALELSSVQSIRHRWFSDGPGEEGRTLEPYCFSRQDSFDKVYIIRKTPDIIVWKVVFDPPLTEGETAKYSYTHKSDELFPLWREKCERFWKDGHYHGAFVPNRYTIIYPTELLDVSIRFPPNYSIILPSTGGFGVYRGYAEDLKEKTRLLREKSFQVNWIEELSCSEIHLRVKNPKQGASYELQWIPPKNNLEV